MANVDSLYSRLVRFRLDTSGPFRRCTDLEGLGHLMEHTQSEGGVDEHLEGR